ncbi:MAG: DUF3416 domain-containing protein [Rhodospirillaceae bacterium]|nr:DUF3416 domain-containing protein [Rhodospirillaceae bacterium]
MNDAPLGYRHPSMTTSGLERLRSLSTQRFVISDVAPEIDGGRYPVKREVGDVLEVYADLICDGHAQIAGALLYREQADEAWREVPLRFHDNDRWTASFPLERNTRYTYTVAAWIDEFESWRRDVTKKVNAGQDVSVDMTEGADLVGIARGRAKGEDRASLDRLVAGLAAAAGTPRMQEFLFADETSQLMRRYGTRVGYTQYDKDLEVFVDRVRARYAAWYEMFWRSQGSDPSRGSTIDECIARLPYIRDMGFDVVYTVPWHPIGRKNRKGRNNTLNAGPGDPGSPYAIGSDEGGHTALNSEWGTLDDFKRLVAAVHEHGMELAMDFAVQCAPDHPWIKQHPDWFKWRPDGTIRYAENPPKRYEDIVNVEFYAPHGGKAIEPLWVELRDAVLFWAELGVRTVRVDNPHTKPLPFWEWLIREVQDRFPDVVFLAEAFTRPKLMKSLAKLGFTQGYTYFTWRNTKGELTSYLEELTQGPAKEYMRGNFFANTPDILPTILQQGGRPAFMHRAVLAATLSSVYGIYNGYELCENAAVPGKEEYWYSEKYQYKVWDWDRPGNIRDWITRLNKIRAENPALHEYDNLKFYNAWDDNILVYGKMARQANNFILVAVNLDPYSPHEAHFELPLWEFGLPDHATVWMEELITGYRFTWTGKFQHIWIDNQHPAFIWRVKPA